MTAEANVKGYAPLPQSISNTDTEDEDEDHHQHSRTESLSKEDNQSRISDTTQICQNGRFCPLDETKNLANRSSRNGRGSFGYSTDNIPIMILDGQSHDDLWKRHDMSPLRRFCLVASVLLCVLTILIFLYVLPCDNSAICPPVPEPKTSVSWDYTLEGVELHGRITLIPGKPYNLIFLARGQQFGDRGPRGPSPIHPDGGGVMSIQGTSGIPLWLVPLKRVPTDIDCELLDADGSGRPACLVSGQGGLLVSIDAIAGTIHWNADTHIHADLPLLLSDVDADGVDDLLSVELANPGFNLVLLSGRTGKLVHAWSMPKCQRIRLDGIDAAFVLKYTCYNESSVVEKTMLVRNLIESANDAKSNRKLSLTSLPTPSPSTTLYPNHTSADVWDLTPYHRLRVSNLAGEACPADECRARANLTLRRGAKESPMWNRTSPMSFVAKPALLTTESASYTTGFALKFWSWTNSIPKTSDKNKIPLPGDKVIRQQNLTERVCIVYVNNTDVREMNPSQSELLQMCGNNGDCQPSLPRQAHSISIADLNGDGVLELISYRSGYSYADDPAKANLTTKVQVVKLDSVF